jgi:hypothetical protein
MYQRLRKGKLSLAVSNTQKRGGRMQAQPAVKKKIKSVSYSHWGYFFIAPFFIEPDVFEFNARGVDGNSIQQRGNNASFASSAESPPIGRGIGSISS